MNTSELIAAWYYEFYIKKSEEVISKSNSLFKILSNFEKKLSI